LRVFVAYQQSTRSTNSKNKTSVKRSLRGYKILGGRERREKYI